MSNYRKPTANAPRTMRAVQVGAFGGIEKLHLSSIPVPTPRRGEVLVRVGAAGVGPWDALAREGRIGLALDLPVTIGAELSNAATGPAKVYRAGESFFEPPGSEHLVSENASASEPASLLAHSHRQ